MEDMDEVISVPSSPSEDIADAPTWGRTWKSKGKKKKDKKEKKTKKKKKKKKKKKSKQTREMKRILLMDAAKRGVLVQVQHYFFDGAVRDAGKMGAVDDVTDDDGLTMLHWAARKNHLALCRWLLAEGANVNRPAPRTGMTPLHFACLVNAADVVVALRAAGADPGVEAADGTTAFELGFQRLVDLVENEEYEEHIRILKAQLRHAELEEEKRLRDQERTWEEKIRQEAFEESFETDDWMHHRETGAAPQREREMDDEEYRQHIVRGMAQRKRARWEAFTEQHNYDTPEAKQRKAKLKAERERRKKEQEDIRAKIAAQEAEREKLRQRFAEEKRKLALETAEKRWCAFEVSNDPEIAYDDVPWPPLSDTITAQGSYLGQLIDPQAPLTAAQRTKVVRKAYLRWHPDKFSQSFGRRLKTEDRSRILDQVTKVAQYIGKLKGQVEELNLD